MDVQRTDGPTRARCRLPQRSNDAVISRRLFTTLPLLALAPRTAWSARSATPRIVAPDWAAAEILLSIGIEPLGIADAELFRTWQPDLPLGRTVSDLGARGEPNLELTAWLRPDLIFISNWQSTLEGLFARIAETQTVTIIDPPSSPLANARRAALRIGDALDQANRAEAYVASFDAALAGFATLLASIGARDVIVGVLHENGRQIYCYGPGSWVHDVLLCLGLRNALVQRTSRFGNALVELADLAASGPARLIYLDQGRRTRQAEAALAHSPLWRALPMVRAGRVQQIPAFYPLGGVSSAWRFARLLTKGLAEPEHHP